VSRIVLGTRGSALALAQAELTRAALAAEYPELQIDRQTFTTRGDQKLDLALLQGEAGGKGLFTKELEDALLAGTIDVAVHSLKDLPGNLPEGLQLAAVLERAPTADVLITRDPLSFEALPRGGRIGTSSVRRARQIQWLRPDLTIEEWRGNVGTRLRKLRDLTDVNGIVLAEAGLRRLGYEWTDTRLVTAEGEFHATSLGAHLLPAIGQGAIALQSRIRDEATNKLLVGINHSPTWTAVRAERELQRLLAGDCSLPVGVRTKLTDDSLEISVILFGTPGDPPKNASSAGPAGEPEKLAREVFAALA
jgi:hydroxymethylbilane synthase